MNKLATQFILGFVGVEICSLKGVSEGGSTGS